MKKIIFILVAGAIFAALIPGYATAQGLTATNKTDNGDAAASIFFDDHVTKTGIKSMKENLKAARANFRAASNFSENFKNATDVKWATESKSINASFTFAGMLSRVVYDKKGSWLYTILNYGEEDLPGEIRSQVKNNFPSFVVKLVQEIIQGDAKVYKIHLENSSTLKQILVSEGNITEYGQYTKSL